MTHTEIFFLQVSVYNQVSTFIITREPFKIKKNILEYIQHVYLSICEKKKFDFDLD